ncbi:Hypp495 [Branchiostoma lanceolatum]|uniref:Hypp495 protein n=1 Tax=Branchiostoma lanceolatum TaxID=7740 RepID=A0A8J9VBP3_BRALA|nr:Hypp495 [Branchiostoma lanceolatum]
MSNEGSVVQEAEHAGISRMPTWPARPVDIQAVRPRRWREPNSDWRTVVRPPSKPSGDSPYVAPDLSGLKIADDNSNNAFRIDVNLLRQKQEDVVAPEEALCCASNDFYPSAYDKTGSPRLIFSDPSLLTTPASQKAPKLKPQLGRNDKRSGRAARLSTSSSAVPVRATFHHPPTYGTVQYSPAIPTREDPPRPPTRRGHDTADERFSPETSGQPNGVAEHDDTVVHPPPGATKPKFRRPRTMYRVAACQDTSVYIKIATEERESSTPSTSTDTRRGLPGSDNSTGYAEVLKIDHEEPRSEDAALPTENIPPGYSFFVTESGPTSETKEEHVATSEPVVSENDNNSEANRYSYWMEENPYEYRHVTGFDPDEYILDLFDQGRITATQKRQAYSSGVEFPDSAYHIEQMFGLHGEKDALFLDNNTPVSTDKQSYSFDDHAVDLLVGNGNDHHTVEDIIYSYEHGGLGNGGTGHRHVQDDERAWSKLLGDLTEVEGLLESSEPAATNVLGRQGTQNTSSRRKKQKKLKAKKKGSTRRRKSTTEQPSSRKEKSPNPSFKELDSTETRVSPGLNELKLAPPCESRLTDMYSETPEARRYREVRDVNRYVSMMDNRKSILYQFGPDPTDKRKCRKPRPAPRPHDPVSGQLEGTEEMYHAEGGIPMTENAQNAIAFLYGDTEVFEGRPSGFFTKAAADEAACRSPVSMTTGNMDADHGGLRCDPGDDWATLNSDLMD